MYFDEGFEVWWVSLWELYQLKQSLTANPPTDDTDEIYSFLLKDKMKTDGVYGVSLHEPVSFVALVRPDLFTYKEGVLRVDTQNPFGPYIDGPRTKNMEFKQPVD